MKDCYNESYTWRDIGPCISPKGVPIMSYCRKALVFRYSSKLQFFASCFPLCTTPSYDAARLTLHFLCSFDVQDWGKSFMCRKCMELLAWSGVREISCCEVLVRTARPLVIYSGFALHHINSAICNSLQLWLSSRIWIGNYPAFEQCFLLLQAPGHLYRHIDVEPVHSWKLPCSWSYSTC